MKGAIIFLIIFFLSSVNLMSTVLSPVCCMNATLGGRMCYPSGVCCKKNLPDEYWHPTGCFDFKLWTEPTTMMFNVGKKTRVNLYIENTGTYDDNYTVEAIIDEDKRALIQVDMSYVTPTGIVNVGEIKKLYPQITILSTDASEGTVIFNVTSEGDSKLYESSALIVQAGLPTSLPEFNFLSMFVLIGLVGIIYFLYKSNYYLYFSFSSN